MKRVPIEVEAVVIPDLQGIDLWAEIDAAGWAGVRVVLTAEQAKQIVREHKRMGEQVRVMAGELSTFRRDNGE